jgi:predicted permease
MSLWRQLARGLRALTNQRDADQDTADEVAHFLEQATADHVARGLSSAAARRAARLEVGNVTNIREMLRDAGWENVVRTALLTANLKVALRGFRRAPGFTFSALFTLAICLGANLTVFAVLDSVVLRALPFPNADRLVAVYNTYPNAGVDRDGSSITNYYERRDHIPAFSNVALYRPGSAVVGEPAVTERTDVIQVTSDFFATLGVSPRLGRAFSETEMDAGRGDVAILTESYWRDRFGADTAVVGRNIRINGTPRTVVGVLPRSFSFLSSTARIVLPLVSSTEQRGPSERHSGSNTEMIARVRPGATIAEAQAQIDRHNSLVEKSDPQAKVIADAGFRSVVLSLHGDHIAAVRPVLTLLQCGVLLLVLIGSVNLANLLSIRAANRAKELTIRQAIGAGRGHIIGQVITETLLLTIAGGVLGLAIGAIGVRMVTALGVSQLPLGAMVAFRARAAGVTMLAASAIGVAIALPIAFFHLRARPAESLGSESRTSTSGSSAFRMRNAFTIAQVSLAFVLLAGSLLLGVSLDRAMAVSPGFHASHVLTGRISLPRTGYGSIATMVSFTDRLDDATAQQPGVIAVGAITTIPLSGNTIKSAVTVSGYDPKPGESLHGYYTYGVTGDYFSAIGIPLLEGRFLVSADTHRDVRVCVVDEDFAKRYWPHERAIGHQVFRGGEDGKAELAFTIVGVVGPVKQAAVTEAGQGAVYFPFAFRADGDLFVVVRTRQMPEAFATTVTKLTRQIDPDLPVSSLETMDERVAASLIARRSPALLAALFAGVALLLAGIGTYGVLSYAVAQRRREIGIRLALGAQPGEIGRQFLARGGRLLAVGLAFGLAGAWAAGRFMQRVLFGVPAFHLPTVAAASVIVCIAAMLASLIPALRASRIDPLVALGSE